MGITVENDKSAYVLYARVGMRVKAFFVDYFIVMGAFLTAALVGANIPGTGAAAFAVWLGFFLLYEPLMVWRSSGTVGHHLFNLRVVSDRTGGPPTLLRAMLRNLVKAPIGVVSLAAMAGSRRLKSIHDWAAGTTVQIRDESRARVREYRRVAWGRFPSGQHDR